MWSFAKLFFASISLDLYHRIPILIRIDVFDVHVLRESEEDYVKIHWTVILLFYFANVDNIWYKYHQTVAKLVFHYS